MIMTQRTAALHERMKFKVVSVVQILRATAFFTKHKYMKIINQIAGSYSNS